MRLQSLVDIAALPFPRSRRLGRQQLVIPRLWGLSAPLRALRFSSTPATGVLLVAPADEGNLGDEAILQGTATYLLTHGMNGPVGVVSFGKTGQWRQLKGMNEHLNLQHLLNGPATREWLAYAKFARLFRHAVILGTDCMDGYYSVTHTLQRQNMAQLAAALGLSVSIPSISINARPDTVCMEGFRKLSSKVAVSCRDPLSAERLQRLSGRNVITTADLAFLLEPDESSATAAKVIGWIAQQKARGRVVVGVNINSQLTRTGGQDDEQILLASVAQTLTQLHRHQRASFLFIPHDRRGPRNDSTVGADLVRILDDGVRQNFAMLEEPYGAAEVKGIAGHCDLVVTGLMHIAIAALGRGVPVACLTYQGKFEGLLEHFGIAAAGISPRMAMDKTAFLQFVTAQFARREAHRQAIVARLPAILRLAAANLKGIVPAATGICTSSKNAA